MLELLEQGFNIINFDESWLNEIDFQRRKWHDRNESNSLPKKGVSPRLSILAAIDTEGRIFMALSTTNTTSEVVCLFVKMLVLKLDQYNQNWKEKTVL